MRRDRIYRCGGPGVTDSELESVRRWVTALDPTLLGRIEPGSVATVVDDVAHFVVFDQRPTVDPFGRPESLLAVVSDGRRPRVSESVPLNGHDPDDFGVPRYVDPSPGVAAILSAAVS